MDLHNYYLIAHRGGSLEEAENTLRAFKYAKNTQIAGIECDIQLTKDLIPVVFHDDTLHRISNGNCKTSIKELSFKELGKINLSQYFRKPIKEKIPSLDQLMSLPLEGMFVNLEIKQKDDSFQLLSKVKKNIDECEKHSHSPQFIIGSLSIPIVLEAYRQDPSSLVAGIIDNEEQLQAFIQASIPILSINEKMLTPKLIAQLKDDNFILWSWTVNDIHRARELFDLGVNGIITDCPAKLKHHLF